MTKGEIKLLVDELVGKKIEKINKILDKLETKLGKIIDKKVVKRKKK